jgi:hypothetical protein
MPGLGSAHHQVARHPVAVHGHGGWARALATGARRSRVPGAAAPHRPGDAVFALHAPVGNSCQLASAAGLVVGRQHVAGTCAASAPAPHRVAHQLVGLAGWRLQRAGRGCGPGRSAAGSLAPRRGQHRGACRPARCDQAGDVHERPHVLLRRRRVHHDQTVVHAAVEPKVAAKARVGGRRALRRLLPAARVLVRQNPGRRPGAPHRLPRLRPRSSSPTPTTPAARAKATASRPGC